MTRKLTLRFRCKRKVRHPNPASAYSVIIRMRLSGDLSPLQKTKIYICPYCHGFHWTSHPETLRYNYYGRIPKSKTETTRVI